MVGNRTYLRRWTGEIAVPPELEECDGVELDEELLLELGNSSQ